LQRASALSGDGKLDVRRGTLLVALERWDEAVQALEAGLLKGKMDDPGRAHLLLGIASNALGNPERAVTSFKNAKTSPNTRRSATQWLTYLQAEKASEHAQ
jgi:tetratricopeptide (TPR) repeat protein